jgi:hypothetical protein
MDSDCPMPANECQTRVCNSGTCGVTFVTQGMLVSAQTAGDCKQRVCDGAGNIDVAIDDNDKPSTGGNLCLQSVCTAGVPTTPPATEGTACSNPNNASAHLCNDSGVCVECNNASTCPGGPDGQCHSVTCDTGVCGISFKNAGTSVSPQPSGDCQKLQCDGAGNIESVADDGDTPDDNNECTADMCVAGVPMTPNRAHGTSCTVNGRTCDGAGACITSFSMVRINVAGTTNVGAPAFIEERKLDGTLVGTPIALPTTASGANQILTLSQSSTSEASLSLSGNGRYLIVGGYAAAVNASTGSVARIVGRIDAAGNVNTTTTVPAATIFNGNNMRGATSQDGTGFWASGAGSPNSTGGVWWIPLGGTGPVQVLATPNNTRWPHVFGGQLYVSTIVGGASPMAIGTGLPITSGQTAATLTGLPTANASPFSYVFFDRDLDANPNTTAPDTLYIADDAQNGSTNPGIQKWTKAVNGTWSRQYNFTAVAAPNTFRGLTGFVTGANVTIIGTTTENIGTRVFAFVDTGTAPTGTLIATAPITAAPVGQGYRGLAPSPVLP